VNNLPLAPENPLPFEIYSGYIPLPAANGAGKQIHYYFVTSQQDKTKDPVMLWLEGGPGCSGLNTMFYENGPFYFPANKTNLVVNDYSWNKISNVLYIDQPAGVGFSIAETDADWESSDEKSAEDNIAFLVLWFEQFSEFLSNDFYIGGESYGGIYVPYLASKVQAYNKAPTNAKVPKINLSGILVGNGVTDWDIDCNAPTPDYNWYHALYGQELRDEWLAQECITPPIYNGGTEPTAECKKMFNDILYTTMENVNPYFIYGFCWHFMPDEPTKAYRDLRTPWKDPEPREKMLGRNSSTSCIDARGSYNYFNDIPAVRTALHVGDNPVYWEDCTTNKKFKYTYSKEASYFLYPDLIKSGIRVLIYSGDCDTVVNYMGSMAWMHKLVDAEGYQTNEEWHEWTYDSQIAGYTQEFNNNFRFTTIKGTGHMAIWWAKPQGLKMYDLFLTNGKYD
jgi:serine carboxypeptidase-like clade 1